MLTQISFLCTMFIFLFDYVYIELVHLGNYSSVVTLFFYFYFTAMLYCTIRLLILPLSIQREKIGLAFLYSLTHLSEPSNFSISVPFTRPHCALLINASLMMLMLRRNRWKPILNSFFVCL